VFVAGLLGELAVLAAFAAWLGEASVEEVGEASLEEEAGEDSLEGEAWLGEAWFGEAWFEGDEAWLFVEAC